MAARPCCSACRGGRPAPVTTPSPCSTAAASPPCASRATCPITACSTKSACSPRSAARTDRLPRRAPRRADLRGHLGTGGGRMLPESGAEILISPNGSPYWPARMTCGSTSPWPGSPRAACPSSMKPGGGQDELVFDGGTFVLNADCRSAGAALLRRDGGQGVFARETGGWRVHRGPRPRRCSTTTRPITPPACSACAITSQKNNFPGVVLGMSGGVEFGALRRSGGRCAGAFKRPCDHAALSVHVGGIASGRCRMCRASRSAL